MSTAIKVRTNSAAAGGAEHAMQRAHRPSGCLGDGTAFAVVADRNNNDKLYLYHSSDRYTWTLKLTVALTVDIGSFFCWAVALDSSDNIHIVYTPANVEKVKYLMLSKGSGYTWTQGSTEDAFDVSGRTFGRVALDCLDSGAIVVAALNEPTAGGNAYFTYRIRHTSSLWATRQDKDLGYTGSVAANGRISVARDAGGAASNIQKFATLCHAGQNKQAKLFMTAVNIVNGTESSHATLDASAIGGHVDAVREFQLFSPSSDGWSVQALTGTGSTALLWAGSFSSTAYIHAMASQVVGNPVVTTGSRGTPVAFGYVDGLKGLILYRTSAGAVMAQAITYGVGPYTITFGPAINWSYNAEFGSFFYLISGNNRNFDEKSIDVLMTATTSVSGFHIYHTTNTPPDVPPTTALIIGRDENGVIYNPYEMTPVDGATVDTGTPTMQVGLYAWQLRVKAQFQIATDTAFTTGVRNLIEPDTDLLIQGLAEEVVPAISALTPQGAFYMRAKAIDELGLESDWTDYNAFTVSHPPTTSNHTPATRVAYGATNTFSWLFGDTNSDDVQTAYQIVISKVSDGSTVLDTGKVTSTAQMANIAVGSGNKNLELVWKIRVWDTDDVVGPYTSDVHFMLMDAGTVAITAPTGVSVPSPGPTVQWTFTPAVVANVAYRYRVFFYETATFEVVHDSGTIISASPEYIPPSPAAFLEEATEYTVYVYVEDVEGLVGSDSETFTTSWTLPTPPSPVTLDSSVYATDGYVTVEWDNSDIDSEFIAWRVYRITVSPDPPYPVLNPSGTWDLVGEVTTDDPTYSFEDYFAPSNSSNVWAVVQVANRFGSNVESLYTSVVTGSLAGDSYWLLHPTDPDLNLLLAHVTEESFQTEYEEEELKIIGRGRKYERGTNWGRTGSITAELRGLSGVSAREERLKVEALKDAGVAMFFRNPFGDVWKVNMGQVQITRTPGVGMNEYTTLSMPYSEVF